MTMVIPGSIDRRGSPSYPWSPEEIEELTEVERKIYLDHLREVRKALHKSTNK